MKMLNPALIKRLNKNLLSDVIKNVVIEKRRNYIDPRKHFEPPEISWQWTPQDCAQMVDCPVRCIPTKCPKKRFLPRFKRAHIPATPSSCPVKKVSTMEQLTNYFSFLLPDRIQEARKIKSYEACRMLAAMRRKCTDPMEWECCRTCFTPPKEWYSQGVVHVLVAGEGSKELKEKQLQAQQRKMEPVIPCPAPSRMIPRGVQAKHGKCNPSTVEDSASVTPDRSLPYQELAQASPDEAPENKTPPYHFKKKKSSVIIPPVLDKSARLSCRSYSEFKTVDFPPQLFSRFKPVPAVPKQPNDEKAHSDKKNVHSDKKNVHSNDKKKKAHSNDIKKGQAEEEECLIKPAIKKRNFHTLASDSFLGDAQPQEFHTVYSVIKEMKEQDPNSPTCPKRECQVEEPPPPPPPKKEEEEEEPIDVKEKEDSCVKNTAYNPHSVERQSCQCFSKPVKRAKKGFLCSLAGVFGIGCGKKCFKKFN